MLFNRRVSELVLISRNLRSVKLLCTNTMLPVARMAGHVKGN